MTDYAACILYLIPGAVFSIEGSDYSGRACAVCAVVAWKHGLLWHMSEPQTALDQRFSVRGIP